MNTPTRTAPQSLMRLIRAAFILYAIALCVGTHWPQLRIDGPVPRTDIWIHIGAFGLLTTLLSLAAFFAPRWSARNISRSVACALVYAVIDEWTQAIPILGRTAAVDDYLADAAGILLAGATLALFAARKRSPTRASADTPSQT